jgi:hypothetical protein
MSHNTEIKYKNGNENTRPQVSSYDSGYEHSYEHWIEVRQLVEDFEEQITVVEETSELLYSV